VAHMRRARGERMAVEDVGVLPAFLVLGRRLERVGDAPGLLPLRLDRGRVVDRRRLRDVQCVSDFDRLLNATDDAPDGTRTRI